VTTRERIFTKAQDVPQTDSDEFRALSTLMGRVLTTEDTGFLVGYAAGKAALDLPKGARIVRVVVVAVVPEGA